MGGILFLFDRLSENTEREKQKLGFHQDVFMCIFDMKIKIPEWKQENQKTLKISQKIFKLEGGGKVGVPTKDKCK